MYVQLGLNLGPLVIHFDAHLTKLTWQVLIDGNSLLFFAPIDFLDLDDLAKINKRMTI